jgi:hypothetical protein
MHFQGGLELIVHAPDGSARRCFGYRNAPVTDPAFVAIVPGDAASEPTARALATAFLSELDRYGPREIALPCSGTPPSWICHSLAVAQARKVLVVVVDPGCDATAAPYTAFWQGRDASFIVLPVLSIREGRSVDRFLPPGFERSHAAFWDRRVDDVVPAILRAAGVLDERPRVFISYRRSEATPLALQLFDALGRVGVDVFIDHARLPSGYDFLARLREELGRQSVLLAIETPSYLASPWVRWEVGVAKSCSLGILALNVTGAPQVRAIDPNRRASLLPTDLAHDGTLFPTPLQVVVNAIRRSHDRALLDRTKMLRESFTTEVLRYTRSVSVEGLQTVRVMGANGLRYAVRIALRAPELADFHTADSIAHGDRAVVVGLTRLMGRARLAQMIWLRDASNVELVDQSQLAAAARDAAGGTL